MKKVAKKDFNTFLAYFGWTIPIMLMVFWASYFFIYRQIYATKPYEKITILYAAYGVKDNSLHTKHKSELESHNCYEVNHYSYNRDSQDLIKHYNALAPLCDYFVFSETDLNDMHEAIEKNFKPVSTDLVSKCNIPSSYSYYSFGTTNYGIKLYDKSDETYNSGKYFSNYINFSNGTNVDSYYLLINKNSVNFDESANHILGYLGLEYLFNELN